MVLEEFEFPAHVKEALRDGKLWRAKEILRGRIGTLDFSPDLFEQYGVVLLEMHDLLQAGKYLFISGRRRPEYETAIEIYLQRHGKKGPKYLVDSFPTKAKILALEELPATVRDELRARGLTKIREDQPLMQAAVPVRRKFAGYAAVTGCFALLFLAAASLLTGLPIVLRFIVNLFR